MQPNCVCCYFPTRQTPSSLLWLTPTHPLRFGPGTLPSRKESPTCHPDGSTALTLYSLGPLHKPPSWLTSPQCTGSCFCSHPCTRAQEHPYHLSLAESQVPKQKWLNRPENPETDSSESKNFSHMNLCISSIYHLFLSTPKQKIRTRLWSLYSRYSQTGNPVNGTASHRRKQAMLGCVMRDTWAADSWKALLTHGKGTDDVTVTRKTDQLLF